MSKIVCLDAGHYGNYNRSPVNGAYFEAVQMWKLTELVASELTARGISVRKTRTNQKSDLSLISRGKKAKGCALLASFHSNAASKESVDYPLGIVFRDNARTDLDERSEEIGLALAKVVQDVMGTAQTARTTTKASSSDRDGNGIKDDEYYGVLEGARQVGVPAVILEHSFHTNKRATEWLLSDANLAKLAKAEAECIAAWLGVQKALAASPLPSFKPYMVRVKIKNLNIRTGPGVSYKRTRYIPKGAYTIVKEQDGWGKLKNGEGWIKLSYTEKV